MKNLSPGRNIHWKLNTTEMRPLKCKQLNNNIMITITLPEQTFCWRRLLWLSSILKLVWSSAVFGICLARGKAVTISLSGDIRSLCINPSPSAYLGDFKATSQLLCRAAGKWGCAKEIASLANTCSEWTYHILRGKDRDPEGRSLGHKGNFTNKYHWCNLKSVIFLAVYICCTSTQSTPSLSGMQSVSV